MEVDTSVIDDILRGARYQSEIHDHASFKTFLDRLVLPGMVLHLDPDRPDVHHSWALGPGLRLLPKTTRPKQPKSWDSILILQVRLLSSILSCGYNACWRGFSSVTGTDSYKVCDSLGTIRQSLLSTTIEYMAAIGKLWRIPTDWKERQSRPWSEPQTMGKWVHGS
ncbi:hypothetical protein T265_12293 [Opisthorchis viverrini]|uniref:Uncharacterized protein n=1 Tax=Opisthorchis viverrini TaxID=6198 RepID=A0A074YU92_OPIVI|nr:hypothetical protein T265_12293 [Opisthorchis viverrini]KER18366.1 hypothetical protein T265_12293 [Opisthorchis viverrini]